MGAQGSKPTPTPTSATGAEATRLAEDDAREKNWKRWGPYLSERQWGTVREDYSPHGSTWTDFSHEQARSRTYRWGEDGLLGICDRQARVCFCLGLWNGKDPILKERLFGLTGPEGNHGEDVKELYFYLDSTPTHSYMKGLYKYPQGTFPYDGLVAENARRGRHEREFELLDSGAFDEDRYFDVEAEYAKASPDDILMRVTITNRGPEPAELTLLSQIWFRNTWSWGRTGEGHTARPSLKKGGAGEVLLEPIDLPKLRFSAEAPDDLLFTENESNVARLFGADNATPYVKDAFHDVIVEGKAGAANPAGEGTKAAAVHRLTLAPGESRVVRLRLTPAALADGDPFATHDAIFAQRLAEADAFYGAVIPDACSDRERAMARQSHAGLLWTKQFYHYSVKEWLDGDPSQPTPPEQRHWGRNSGWRHLYNRDVISMPDKWEYPWYAAWDLAFHMVPFASVDPAFAKDQLILFLREWYMHPNGQIPAYEFKFDDVNPPVHAWAVWVVYQGLAAQGKPDREFLARAFHKLLLNFTWWVNRKDEEGNNLFSGGFLGLDNIGVFDRSQALPTGGRLEQADGTGWMAFFCATMLQIALELARHDRTYSDVASKFFEHYIAIVDAMNSLGGSGLWDEEDGFYYDKLHLPDGSYRALKSRSLVGILPICAVDVLDDATIDALPGFKKRMDWFIENRSDLARYISYCGSRAGRRLLAIPSEERLRRVLTYVLDENEFLSPYGVRSLSRIHKETPYVFFTGGVEHRVDYVPGESNTGMFGGNSNWRGPVWFPMNYLIIESLLKYHTFYGERFQIECPTGSGNVVTLEGAALEICRRLTRLFLPDEAGRRPCHGSDAPFAERPAFQDLVLFYEHFDGDDGRGLGASHQTGWTSLVTSCLEIMAARGRGS